MVSSFSETVTSTPGTVPVPIAPRLSLALTTKKNVPVGRMMPVSRDEESKSCKSAPPSFDQYLGLRGSSHSMIGSNQPSVGPDCGKRYIAYFSDAGSSSVHASVETAKGVTTE